MRFSFCSYADAFEKMLSPLDPKLKFLQYRVTRGDLPEQLKECDAYIITGSRFSAYDDEPWIKQLKQFVTKIYTQNKRRIVGICFGHQLLAEALGGKVQKTVTGWGVGVKTFAVKAPSDTNQIWMDPKLKELKLPVSHQDQVSELPENGEALMSANYCPIGAFRISDKILGIQGHPEFTKDYLAALIETRTERIGKNIAEEGISSLDKTTNSDVVALWILNFLKAA